MNLLSVIPVTRGLLYMSHKKGHSDLSLVTRKPVLGVSDQVRLKPACSASETSWRLEISDIETRGIILSRQRTKKALYCLKAALLPCKM